MCVFYIWCFTVCKLVINVAFHSLLHQVAWRVPDQRRRTAPTADADDVRRSDPDLAAAESHAHHPQGPERLRHEGIHTIIYTIVMNGNICILFTDLNDRF